MPHLLVTAPSNTAVDGMVQKILQTRFRDGAGNSYMPNIVRIGRRSGGAAASTAEGQNAAVSLNQVSIEYQVEELIRQLGSSGSAEDFAKRIRWLEDREETIMRDMTALKKQCRLLASQIVELGRATQEQARNHSPDATIDDMINRSSEQSLRLEHKMAALHAFHDKTRVYMQAREKLHSTRLELKRSRIMSRCTNKGQLRAELRESVLENAHIVFVTLSSSALRQIIELGSKFKFEVAIVDEAAQATEPSILVPLQHGVEHCVLVGDPKQLPATILSDRVQSCFYQQSMFERLQTAGHPSYLLDTQYRCHPLISSFPSREFYGSRLKDGPNVRKPDYLLPCKEQGIAAFAPLTFLNVAVGRETRGNMSYRNEYEAALALNIYETLRQRVNAPGMERVGIGIITPYREQLELLRSLFRAKSYLKDPLLDLNTVDGYQGREFDVIIFSCVRAAAYEEGNLGKRVSIGFLNDARRLNVAVTRAKFMLVVLGQEQALSSSKMWRAFMHHIKSTGVSIPVLDPTCDLLRLPAPAWSPAQAPAIAPP